MGARRVMDAVMEGHKSTLSSGKMVALAAGLSVGATVGYIVYRHISSPNNSQESEDTEVSKMTLPVEAYRNISRCQANFMSMVTQKTGAQVRVFFRVGGAWVQDVRLPAAARLQGGGAVGPLRPGEPSY